jgi:hypothetical protein
MTWNRLPTQGIQSDIFVGVVKGVKAVKKLSGEGLTPDQLERVASAIPEYRQDLINHGVKIPDNISVRVTGQKVETVDRFIEGQQVDGTDLKSWRRMTEVITTEGTFIDGKPPNFIQNGREMYYVDTFPPMIKENGLIAPWVQSLFKRDRQMMSYNFGDVRGRLTKLLSLVGIEMPQRYPQLAKTTLDVAKGTLKPDQYEYVESQYRQGLPDTKSMYQHPDKAGDIVRRILNG